MQLRKFKGRFGNRLLWYATLRQLGGASYQCVPWIGQQLFGLHDPMVCGNGEQCPYYSLDSAWYDKGLFRALFQPGYYVMSKVHPFIDGLRQKGHTLIGLHLRRGDYGTFRRESARWCFAAPTKWYVDWVEGHIDSLVNPIFILASDEPHKVFKDFVDYPVVMPHETLPEAQFYPDFYALTQCDILLTSNSTFSFTASMLNEGGIAFYRPRLSEERLIAYDPWNAPVVFKDEKYA